MTINLLLHRLCLGPLYVEPQANLPADLDVRAASVFSVGLEGEPLLAEVAGVGVVEVLHAGSAVAPDAAALAAAPPPPPRPRLLEEALAALSPAQLLLHAASEAFDKICTVRA